MSNVPEEMKKPFGASRLVLSISLQILIAQATYFAMMQVVVFASQQSPEPREDAAAGSTATAKQSRVEISYGGDRLVIFSDVRERSGRNLQRVKGNVTITLLDMILTCEEAEYDEETLRVSTLNPTRFRNRRMSLTSSGTTFDPVAQTVTLKDASGYFYETSGKSDREFFLTGGMSQNIKTETLEIYWGTGKRE